MAENAARHTNWQVALDALIEDAPACGLDPFKVRKRVERVVSHYKSNRTRYDVIRHMHDSMLAEAHR